MTTSPLFVPRCFRALLTTVLLTAATCLRAAASFETISDATTPHVGYAVEHSGSTLTVRVNVGAFRPGQPAPRLQLGLSAASTAVLDQSRAKIEAGKDAWTYTFTLPNVTFATPEEARFRWALLVEWVDASGRSLQRQNYFTPPSWSPYRDIGGDASVWSVFSLADYRVEQERRAQRIALAFEQPIDGKASIVIENADGRRVRNLVTGQPLPAGSHEFIWDGLDEDGLLVPPGDYRWRAISHPGIRPEMQMYFYAPGEKPWASHTWLADHSNPVAAAAHGDRVVLGAPVAESGNNIVLTDLEGTVLARTHLSSFIGLGRLFLALGPDRIYALNEGSPHYNSVRTDADGNSYVYGDLTLVAWDHAGVQQRYKGKNGEHIVIEYKKPLSEGTGSRKDRLRLTLRNLRGAAFLDGLLYLSLHDENRILLVDPKDGGEAGEISVPAPGPIATDGKAIYGLSGSRIFRVAAPKAGASAEMLFACKLSAPIKGEAEAGGTPLTATAMAVNAAGEIFLSDNGVDQNIKVYSPRGKLLRELGTRGGRADRGAWQADAIRHPHGIAIDARGRLWLAENEEAPKRISVWDTSTGRVTKEIFGPTPYGASGGGFDPKDATRWVAAGSLWKLDYQAKTAAIQSVLFHRSKPGQLDDTVGGHNVRTIHHGDRTFLFTKGRTLQVFELMTDGSARLRAVLGGLSGFQAESPRFSVPAVFNEHPLLKDELAAFTQPSGKFGDYLINETQSKNARDYMILWVDRNGDEVAQLDELQVAGKGPRLNIPYWSANSPGLDLGFLVENDKAWSRATLKLRGFLPSGAPDWDLADALATAVPIPGFTPSNLQSTMVDSRDRLLLNASPMYGIDADGSVRWRLRNDWAGVHGSHRAPLPETGVMQGTLGYLGDAAFDQEGDITVLNGNHGRFFALTTDGIYLDEFFDDVRVALERSPNRMGGEAFGGYFSKDAKTGRYLLQAGHGAYRIYEMKGMERLVRSAGPLPVNAAQLAAAQKLHEARVARDTVRKETVLRAATVASDTKPADIPGAWTAEWGDSSRPFPHARVKAVRDGATLVLGYEVKDPTPWLNRGTAQNLLFKTGDAVDFQFSTDASAPATRSDAVPGDRRLLIADYQGKPVAVLYDYRVPGTESPVLFNSPWRSARVDRVTVVADAVIKVTKTKTGYTVVARIPLASLGLPVEGGKTLLADFGVIYGDEDGETNILRSYWANPSTGLVNDVPGETMINPSLWGVLKTE